MKKNTLHTFGHLGMYSCYLNIPYEDALQRYMNEQGATREEVECSYEKLEFYNTFNSYEVSESRNDKALD